MPTAVHIPTAVHKIAKVSERSLHNNIQLGKLMSRIGATMSVAESRRLIRHGIVSINGDVVRDEQLPLAVCDLNQHDEIELTIGRNRYTVVFDDHVEDEEDE